MSGKPSPGKRIMKQRAFRAGSGMDDWWCSLRCGAVVWAPRQYECSGEAHELQNL